MHNNSESFLDQYKLMPKKNGFLNVTYDKNEMKNNSFKKCKKQSTSKLIKGTSPNLEKIKPTSIKSIKSIKSHTKQNEIQDQDCKKKIVKRSNSQKDYKPQVFKKKQTFKVKSIQNLPTIKFTAQQVQKSKGYVIKKRTIRNTTSFNRQIQQKGQLKKSGNSFFRKPTLYQKSKQNNQPFVGKKYYIDDLKRQFQKLIKSEQDNPQMIITHFLQSITTFHTYKSITLPQIPHLNIMLPHNKKDITLIFDMDQTLLHAEAFQQQVHQQEEVCWGQNMDILFDDKSVVKINLKIRPFAVEVLKRLKEKFQIGLFTAGNQIYAKQVLKKIDYNEDLFDFVLFRQHCHAQSQKLSIKDLRILANRDLKKIVLIDNSPHTYLYSPQNAIPITSFYDDQLDTQLLKLQAFLQHLHKKVDIRHFLKDYFKIQRYKHYINAQELIQNLYGQII